MEEKPEYSALPVAPLAVSLKVNWWSVATYYFCACAISWPVFWWRDMYPAQWASWHAPGFVKGWLPALGPCLASIVARRAFWPTRQRRYSLLGRSAGRGVLFALVPILVLGVTGIGNDEPHLTGLWFGVFYVVYALGEEFGWRGFLQDALQGLPEKKRYFLIGVMWGTWHFTTFISGGTLATVVRLAWLYPVWIFASWGLGQSTELTRSVLVAAMLHLIFNFATGLPGGTSIPVLAVSVVTWAFLLRNWPHRSLRRNDSVF